MKYSFKMPIPFGKQIIILKKETKKKKRGVEKAYRFLSQKLTLRKPVGDDYKKDT